MWIFHHQDVPRTKRVEERGPIPGDLEQDEVRPNPRRIKAAGLRLGDVASRLDPVDAGEGLRETPGIGVVLGKPFDHSGRSVAQRHETRRREHSNLAHPAADELASTARPPDEGPVPDHDRSDRAGQGLRQAERNAVGGSAQIRRRNAEGDDGIPEAGAVDVKWNAPASRDLARVYSAVRGRPIVWAWVFSREMRPVIGS
jgi:hypothetical protein